MPHVRLRSLPTICQTQNFMAGRKFIASIVLSLLTPLSFSLPQIKPANEKLLYRVEWRLIQAGTAKVEFSGAAATGSQADVQLQSAGLVSKLFKVNDVYRANMAGQFCATSTRMDAEEGRRHRVSDVKFDRHAKHASYVERDMIKNSVVVTKEIDTPDCVYEVMGGLQKLRSLKLEPGQSVLIPLSDGKKFVQSKVEAQEREEIITPAGKYKTMRYEAFLFNNVFYQRSGRLFVWITEDSRRLPVQIRVRLPIHIGTISLILEKGEHAK